MRYRVAVQRLDELRQQVGDRVAALRQLPLWGRDTPWFELWVGAFAASAAGLAFGTFWWTGWAPLGAPNHCIDTGKCYCEAFDGGVEAVRAGLPGVRQWANTWSNLVPIGTGLLLALCCAWDRAGNRLARSTQELTWGHYYPVIFMLIIGFMGPGSMFFHASITHLGGLIDNLSMLLFVWFLIAYGVFVRAEGAPDEHRDARFWRLVKGRAVHRGRYGRFAAIFLTGVGLSMVLLWAGLYRRGWGLALIVPVVLFPIVEGYRMWKGTRAVGREPLSMARFWRSQKTVWFFAGGVLSFAVALLTWFTGHQAGEGLCDPASRFQWHAVWHVLANVTAALLFLHFRGVELGFEPAEGARAP